MVFAGVLLAVLLAAMGWRAVGALGEAIAGFTFTRPEAAQTVLPSSHVDAALQSELTAATRLPKGTVGTAVYVLGSGATAAVNDQRQFPAASLFKLPILVEALKQASIGRLNLDDTFEIQQRHWTAGSGVLQARIGDRLSGRELLRLMIQESDNIAALVLLDAVGVDNVNETMSAMGLKGTHLRDPFSGETGEHVTTPGDVARLLEVVASGGLVDQGASESALKLLELKQANTWLGEELPWWVKVAHKWGDVPGARHDAGIVYTPRGSYVVVVMTEDTEPDAARQVIATVSNLAYRHL